MSIDHQEVPQLLRAFFSKLASQLYGVPYLSVFQSE